MNFNKILMALVLSSTLTFMSPVWADSFLSPLTDSVNSGIINTKMVTNDSLSHINVDATVINGIAIFTGTVNSRAQVNELIRIARSVSGIKGVDISRLKIAGH